MKKFISIILVLALLTGMLTSCGGNNAQVDAENNNTADQVQEQGDGLPGEENAAEQRIQPNLPEPNFNGYKFTFVCSDFEASDDYMSGAPFDGGNS